MTVNEVFSARPGDIIPTLVPGRLLRVMRVIRVNSVSSNEVEDAVVEASNTVIHVGEILDHDMGLPKGEVFARVCHGRITLTDEVFRRVFAVLGSYDPPDGVVLGCVLIDKDEFVRKALRVELLTDGEVRYVAEVGTL